MTKSFHINSVIVVVDRATSKCHKTYTGSDSNEIQIRALLSDK